MLRAFVVALPLVLAPLPAAAPAYAAPQSDETADGEGQPCKLSKKKRFGSGLVGNVLGNIAGNTIGRSRVGSFISFNTVAQTLTDAIACKLDKDEQKKAARATEVAIERGVGGSESWESETREGVSGSSTVTDQTELAGGGNCMTVSDVIIVEGEETTVDKRMCRAPGASGYTVARA